MALTTAYLVTTKNLDAFFNAIITAQAPERFTTKFLKDLDFTSSNDRLYLGVLKALAFIEDSGAPTERYFQFLDQTVSKRVLATAIREAYEDLFRLNKDAQKLSEEEVKGKLKTLMRGDKSENVLGLMTKTFKALCEYADWSQPSGIQEPSGAPPDMMPQREPEVTAAPTARGKVTALHYNIEIHLPATRDSAVYDAIFKSLREHLL